MYENIYNQLIDIRAEVNFNEIATLYRKGSGNFKVLTICMEMVLNE